MEEHRSLQEESERQEEYSFMQEVIKDETDSARKRKSRFFRFFGYGAVFGLAASIVFCVLTPWIEIHFGSNPEQVEIPNDEETTSDQEKTQGEANEEPESDVYRQVIQSLNITASNAKSSLFTLSGKQGNAEENAEKTEPVSGVVVADNGKEFLILSKIMKVKKGETLEAAFSGQESYTVTVKMQDQNLGIAIYAVDKRTIGEEDVRKITVAELGNSHLIEEGDSVIALGKPFGTDDAVGYGVVTADEKYVEKADGHYRLICTNITAGEEGSGILLNKKGQVVGLIDQSVLGEGSSGRIGGYGISDLKDIIELLSNGSAIPYAGIYGMDVTDQLAKKGMPQGVYVKEVAADSPAMEAGIQSGDVIVGIDGENIGSMSNYHRLLMRQTEGSEIELTGCRQGANEEYVELNFSLEVSVR